MSLVNVQSNNPASIAILPRADEYALAHSQALQQVIRAGIADNDGHISFARFMQMALYEPGLGYYSAGASKFGESGDFITAPEISPLFSVCLARQCAEVLSELEQAVILELGAGTGVMASDVLKELQRLDCLPDKYYILEPSADLRQRQRQLLEESRSELIMLRFVIGLINLIHYLHHILFSMRYHQPVLLPKKMVISG